MSGNSAVANKSSGRAFIKIQYAGRFPGNEQTVELYFENEEKCSVKFRKDAAENGFCN